MRRFLHWTIPVVLLLGIIHSAWAVPPRQENLFQLQLDELRNDMELLADRVFGGGSRPDNWLGTTDFTADNMLADLWVDNEILADAVFGAGVRPAGWIGATSRNAELVARNLRHDLEIAADEWLGEGQRPEEWVGGPVLTRCSRTVMNTVYLLGEFYGVRPETPTEVVDYCGALVGEIEDSLVDQALGAQIEGEVTEENAPSLILAVRGDLERLADEVLGLNNRPPGWIDNTDIDSPTLAFDILADMEVLADIVLGRDIRPEDWIGQLRESQVATFRNLRHDLELLADAALEAGRRPNGWQGDTPIFTCQPIDQYLVFLVERAYGYDLPPEEADNYCEQVNEGVNLLVENPPDPQVAEATDEPDTQFMAESRNAFAYLDPAALEYMGVLPWGVEFRAWYRNFGESTMMFVSGVDFAVFIDRRWTTMSEDAFARLPTLDGVQPLTFCDAGWCNGPAPTPTPTGGGPLVDIITANTPPAPLPTPIDGTPGQQQLQLVNWNYIRVNYLLQRPENNAVQVTLEICREPSQIACEPVVFVFNNATGQAVQPISTFNGLNVYELPYGYSTNFTIEGTNFYSEDLWLDDPALSSP